MEKILRSFLTYQPQPLTPESPVASAESPLKREVIQEADQRFFCPITERMMRKPVRLHCTHTFEKNALRLRIQTGDAKCPTCHNGFDINPKNWKVDYVLQAEIEEKKAMDKALKNMQKGMNNIDLKNQIETLKHEIKRLNEEKVSKPVPIKQETPPKMFLCSITQNLMTSPVMINCGHTFEERAIREEIKNGNSQCPQCGEAIDPNEETWMRNAPLKAKIAQWVSKNKIPLSPEAEIAGLKEQLELVQSEVFELRENHEFMLSRLDAMRESTFEALKYIQSLINTSQTGESLDSDEHFEALASALLSPIREVGAEE